MAVLVASSAFSVNELNFYEVSAGAWGDHFYDNIYLNAGGVIYEDVYEVYWHDGLEWASAYLGRGFTFDWQGNITAGVVSAYGATIWNGSGYSSVWAIGGVSLSAPSLYNAHLTPSTVDDFAIIESALSGADSVTGSSQADFLMSYAGSDTLFGDAGADTLDGGGGNDTLSGGTGIDRLLGGGGNDFYVINDSNDIIIENSAAGSDTISTSVNLAVPLNVEQVRIASGSRGVTITGGSGDDVIIGNGLSNNLVGGAGNDVLVAVDMNPADILALFNGWAGFWGGP